MVFKKGIIVWNKGKKWSEEVKNKFRLAHLGMKVSEEQKAKMRKIAKENPNFGFKNKTHSEESRKKMSQSLKGRKVWNKGKTNIYSQETKRKMNLNKIGKSCSPKTEFKKGQVAWNKGLPKEQQLRYGYKHSEGTKRKIGLANKIANNRPEVINKMREKRAKQIFPIKDTKIEVKIQNFLKELGYEFFTHQYMKIEHGYQCDILIPSMNLVIECDGNYWHKYPTRTDLDNIRTKELLEKGFKVLRLWEIEINEMNVSDFKEKLKECE